jgi:hypothetical protein
MNKTKLIGFKDSPEVVKSLDVLAEKRGVARSDVLRMMVRGQLSATTDAAEVTKK